MPQRAPIRTSSSTAWAFPTSKKDKRHIKHSNLISRVTKSAGTSSAAQKNKRRRQKKQLVANLESLADALPEDGDPATTENQAAGSKATILKEQANITLIHRRSMKSRPGALKRKEKLDRGERERFAKNLAEMSGKMTEATGDNSGKLEIASRVHGCWAALRGFIGQTMEQRPEMRELKR